MDYVYFFCFLYCSAIYNYNVFLIGPQGPKKFRSLKSIKGKSPLPVPDIFTPACLAQKWLPYQNLGDKNCKESTNRSTSKVDMVEKAKCDMSEGHFDIYLTTEKLGF